MASRRGQRRGLRPLVSASVFFGVSIIRAGRAFTGDEVEVNLAVFQKHREREKDAEGGAWIFLGENIVHIVFVIAEHAAGFGEARLGVEAGF